MRTTFVLFLTQNRSHNGRFVFSVLNTDRIKYLGIDSTGRLIVMLSIWSLGVGVLDSIY